MSDNSAAINAMFSSIRSFLIIVGTILAGYGFTNKNPLYFWIEVIAGTITVIGPAAWGVYVSICHVLETRKKVTQAVNAGLNLAASGQMMTVQTTEGAVVPVPANTETAAEIVKTFAPAVGNK